MANKRHKPEEIVTKLRQVDVLVGQGMARIELEPWVHVIEIDQWVPLIHYIEDAVDGFNAFREDLDMFIAGTIYYFTSGGLGARPV